MLNKKSEIDEINKAIQFLKNEIKKTNELLQLLWELMHGDNVLILY